MPLFSKLNALVATTVAGATLIAAPVALAQSTPAPAASSMATPAATPTHYTTSDTTVGTLLDDPAAKAVVSKYLPDIINNPQVERARGITLKQMQTYVPDAVPDAVLAKIDADLAGLPARKQP